MLEIETSRKPFVFLEVLKFFNTLDTTYIPYLWGVEEYSEPAILTLVFIKKFSLPNTMKESNNSIENGEKYENN